VERPEHEGEHGPLAFPPIYHPEKSVLATAGAGDVFAAWVENPGNQDDIYAAGSSDEGRTWSAGRRVNTDLGASRQLNPAIAADSTAVYVAWEDRRNGDEDIYFARSTDSGGNWSDPNLRVDDDIGSANQHSPSLFATPSGLSAVWVDSRRGDDDIRHANSADGGVAWSASTRVNSDTGVSDQRDPVVAVDANGEIHVAWWDAHETGFHIYFASTAWTIVEDPTAQPPASGPLPWWLVLLIVGLVTAVVILVMVWARRRRTRVGPFGGAPPTR